MPALACRTARRLATEFPKLFHRLPEPILTASMWPYPANSVFNPGATRLADGRTLLLVRVEDRRGISHLTTAISEDGFTDWQINEHPCMVPEPDRHPEELWGIEDPRITWIEELQRYAITYTAYSRGGPLVSLALTADFEHIERLGAVMPPEDKDAALFPYRFGGRWAMLHRPVSSAALSGAGPSIWLSFSPDLVHWGDHQVLLPPREGAWWDARKIGLSPPPIETDAGWLIMYHGVRQTASGALYRLGLALLDRDDPRLVLRRGLEWVFGPEEPYERLGDVNDVVFPCGTVHIPESDELRIYYGAADTSVAAATARVSELVQWLQERG